MSKLDFRKKRQYIGNIYIWKEHCGFGVGINGTSEHYKVYDKESLNEKISHLKTIKEYRP